MQATPSHAAPAAAPAQPRPGSTPAATPDLIALRMQALDIALHMQAINCLNRCKSMLLADKPMYPLAQQWLAQAQQVIADLHAIDQLHSTEG